jgi:glycosyl transferase family 87
MPGTMTRGLLERRFIDRLGRGLTIALIIGMSIGLTLTFVGMGEALGLVPGNPVRDWHAYWSAAERLRDGAPLYPALVDQGSPSVYRYPPWFAVAWIPLTYLPRDLVGTAWVGLMFLASAVALWPLLTSRRWPAVLLGALFAPYLAQASIAGNVQPLLVAALVRTLDARGGLEAHGGPIVIGVAASLKGFPLAYAIRYAALGQWRRFFTAVAAALVLTAPILLFDLSHYPLYAGALAGLWIISPLAWAAGAVFGLAAALRYARTPASWFATSFGVVLVLPRLLLTDTTFLLVTGREMLRRRPRSERDAFRDDRRRGLV